MKIQGEIEHIAVLVEINSILDNDIEYFVDPSQRIGNLKARKFPRGATDTKIARFLDRQ